MHVASTDWSDKIFSTYRPNGKYKEKITILILLWPGFAFLWGSGPALSRVQIGKRIQFPLLLIRAGRILASFRHPIRILYNQVPYHLPKNKYTQTDTQNQTFFLTNRLEIFSSQKALILSVYFSFPQKWGYCLDMEEHVE